MGRAQERQRTRHFRASIAFPAEGAPVVLKWDTYSNTNLIHPAAVPPSAEWLSREKTPLGGVVEGATLMCEGIVMMHVRLVAGGAARQIDFKVAPPPQMADCLVGFPEMDALGAVPRADSNRVYVQVGPEIVLVDYI